MFLVKPFASEVRLCLGSLGRRSALPYSPTRQSSHGRRCYGCPVCEGNCDVPNAQSLGLMSNGVSEDNKGVTNFAGNPLSSFKSKHNDVWCHFLRVLAASGDISIKYLESEY